MKNVGNRIHTHSKIGVEANRLQHGFAGDILAVWEPADGGVVTVNGEMLLPVFMSDVAHGILLLDELEGGKANPHVSFWNTTAREAKKGLTSFFPRYQLHAWKLMTRRLR